MAVFLSDPFDALLQFQRALDNFRASSWLGASPSGGGTYPPLNVFHKGDDIVVITGVPGIRKADLEVQVKGNTIRISGTKSVAYGERIEPAAPRSHRQFPAVRWRSSVIGPST
jgi:HSP20 family protein